LWRSKRHTCLRKAARLKRPSPTDSRLKKCTTFRHLACTRVIKLASVFFGGRGRVSPFFFFFDLTYIIMFRHIQRNFFVGILK
jgi:hypothetical protein